MGWQYSPLGLEDGVGPKRCNTFLKLHSLLIVSSILLLIHSFSTSTFICTKSLLFLPSFTSRLICFFVAGRPFFHLNIIIFYEVLPSYTHYSQLCNSPSSLFCPSWLLLLPALLDLLVSSYNFGNRFLELEASNNPSSFCWPLLPVRAPQVDAEAAAMTDRNGNVVAFDAANVGASKHYHVSSPYTSTNSM